MGIYFKPLRRKIGVITLGLACVFAAAWVRSTFRNDSLLFSRFTGISIKDGDFGGITSHNQALTLFKYKVVLVEAGNGAKFAKLSQVPILIVPYWSIVLPLTLLSAWLLFSRPRARKKANLEPTAAGS